MTNLVIAQVGIRMDAAGRYCLNDLHVASGGENKHKPALWLKNKQTVELIEELSIAGIPAIQSKQGLGTFGPKELVYSYAMWISASFNLKVIRAYDALVSPPKPAQDTQEMIIARGLVAAHAMIAQNNEVIALLAPKAEALDRIATATEGSITITDAAKMLQVSPKSLFERMNNEKWIYQRAGNWAWTAYQDKLRARLLEHKFHPISSPNGLGKTAHQVRVTAAGLTELAILLKGTPPLRKK